MKWKTTRLIIYALLGSSALLFAILFFTIGTGQLWLLAGLGALFAIWTVIDVATSTVQGQSQPCPHCGTPRTHRSFSLSKKCPKCGES